VDASAVVNVSNFAIRKILDKQSGPSGIKDGVALACAPDAHTKEDIPPI
jgi:hypothetical protein